MKYHFLAFIAILSLFLIQPVSAIPQININSPSNQTYYTNEIFINITQDEANPAMMWYLLPEEELLLPFTETFTSNLEPSGLVQLWNYSSNFFGQSLPVIDDGIIYVGGYYMFAFYLNGTKKWDFALKPSSSISNTPVVHDGIVYFGSSFNDKNFYALDLDGQKIWNFSIRGMTNSNTILFNETLYFNTFSGLYALDLDGNKLWNKSGYDVDTSPIVVGGSLYAITGSGLDMLDTEGNEIGNFTPTGYNCENSPFFDGDYIYIACETQIFSLYPNLTLHFNFTNTGGDEMYSVTSGDDVIFSGCDDESLYAIYKNGTTKWLFGGGGTEYGAIVTADGNIYYGDWNGVVHKLDSNGNELANITFGNTVYRPVIVGGVLYIPSEDDHLYAFGDGSSTNSLERTITLPYGSHELKIYSRDASGNYNESTVYFTNSVLPPTITIITPENTNYNDTTLLLNYTSDSDLEDGWFSLDGGVNNSLIGLSFEENLSTYICTGSFYINLPGSRIFDGIYSTGASTTYTATCYFNRTRPANGSLSANLSVALGDPNRPTACLGIWNATVSQNCLGNYIGDIVQFKLFMTVASPYGTDWSCWNGTDWESFFSCYGLPIDDDVREEAIWWITTKPITRKYFTAENGSHTINVCGENAGGENCSQRNFTILTITPPIPPIPPAPEPEVPLASGVILSTILIAGGLISFLGIVFTTKDIKYIVGGMIFLLIILTLSAQMLIII